MAFDRRNPVAGSRDWLGGLGAVGGVLALVGVGITAILGPALACACTTPPALVVHNRADTAATIEWRDTGWFGASGRQPVPACSDVTTHDLRPGGSYEVVVAGVAARWEGIVVAPTADGQAPGLELVVLPDGRIERAWGGASFAGSPCSPPDAE